MRNVQVCLASTGMALVSLAFFVPASSVPARAQALERPIMNAEQCHPLSPSNYELCCVARNRIEILTPSEIDQCPPMTTAQINSVLSSERPGEHGNAGPGVRSTGSGGSGRGSAGGGSGGAPALRWLRWRRQRRRFRRWRQRRWFGRRRRRRRLGGSAAAAVVRAAAAAAAVAAAVAAATWFGRRRQRRRFRRRQRRWFGRRRQRRRFRRWLR